MPFGYEARNVKFGNKPHLLVGTMLGTLAVYIAFVRHYQKLTDDSEPWVWFGIRSDGRCGRDFENTGFGTRETQCGKGQCCSSHGWCGHTEEYCSIALGCQNGCWPGTAADAEKRDEANNHHDANAPDEEDYMDRMHHYRYDEDGDYSRRRRYGHHDEYHHDEYHHRYDDHGMHGGHGHHYGDDDHEGQEPHDDHEGFGHRREPAGEHHYGHDGVLDREDELDRYDGDDAEADHHEQHDQ